MSLLREYLGDEYGERVLKNFENGIQVQVTGE